MDYDKIGLFLKELRLSKNMSQYDLAELMHVDHSKINRIENNKRRPSFDDLIFYSQIFSISLDELINCERKNKNNSKIIQNNFLNYLKKENSKYKKIKFLCFVFLLFSILGFIGFIGVYFFQNYDSTRLYTFYGSSKNYEITNGIFFLSKEKMYFQIEKIFPEVENIKIYSEINNERKLIYQGDYKTILQDKYGYEGFVSYDDFINGKQKFFVAIKDEEILLNFTEEFSNNNFIYNQENEIGQEQNKEQNTIPEKIKANFQCDENKNCTLTQNDTVLIYSAGFFFINNKIENYTYDLSSQILSYSNFQDDTNFEVSIDNVNCIKGNCKNAYDTYIKFYNNYVKKYLE